MRLNNNNNNNNTWETIIGDVIDLLEPSVRDVLTTLDNMGEREVTETVNLDDMVEDQGSVSLDDLVNHANDTNSTIGARRGVGLAELVNSMQQEESHESRVNEESETNEADEESETIEANEESEFVQMVGGVLHEEYEQEIQEERYERGHEEFIESHVRGGQEVSQNTGNNNNNQGTMTLEDLFNQTRRVSDLDERGTVTLEDLTASDLATTYNQPTFMFEGLDSRHLVEFGENVTRINRLHPGTQAEIYSFNQQTYQDFGEDATRMHDENTRIERQRRESNSKYGNIQRIVREIFGQVDNLYGMDKVGRNRRGEPYAKAMLATRFSKLYDRRFRSMEELNNTEENVAIANTNPSVLGTIEAVFTRQGNQINIQVTDSDGERLTYLEDKFNWLMSNGTDRELIVLYLKTQYEFEEYITTLDELKGLEFPRE